MACFRWLSWALLLGPVCLTGCQRSSANRPPTPEMPTSWVAVVRDGGGEGKEVGQTVNGLALALTCDADRLAPGKQVHCTVTLFNRSDKTFQVALHDSGCCLWSNLRFEPALELGGSGHTVKPNYFPGGVHLIFAGGKLALKFRLERTADGKALFMPTQAHQGAGCGNTFAVPAGLKQVGVQFALHGSAEGDWSNLKFTEQRWSGECVSNAVTLQLE